MGRCARIQSYMSNGDWLNTSRDLLIGYWGVCMWCNDVDWLTSGEVGMISAWSMHVYYVEARWEVTCKELMLFMQLGAKYTYGASLTPHNRNYISFNLLHFPSPTYWLSLSIATFYTPTYWLSLLYPQPIDHQIFPTKIYFTMALTTVGVIHTNTMWHCPLFLPPHEVMNVGPHAAGDSSES